MKPKKAPSTKTTVNPAPVAKAAVPASKPAPQPAPSAAPAGKAPQTASPAASEPKAQIPAPKTKSVSSPTKASKASVVVKPVADLAVPLVSSAVSAKPKSSTPAKVVPISASLTAVEARINVGYGNSLYIRGEGASLSWDEGQPLQCEAPDKWVWATKSGGGNLVFKILLNDQVWSAGEDWTVASGEKTEVVPVF